MSQSKHEMLFKVADFDKYQWTEILNQVSSKQCQNYSEKFRAKSEAYQLLGDTQGQEIFKFLSEITSILMEPLELTCISTVEKVILATLSDDHLTFLRELVTRVTDPEMRARTADILWICKRDPEKAALLHSW